MEDLLRAAAFDMAVIKRFVESFSSDPLQQETEFLWFQELAKTMKKQGLDKRGHILEAREIMTELAFLHQTLIGILEDAQYLQVYKDAKPYISEYLQKAGTSLNNDVEACLTALYGLLVLRLRKAEISPETEEAMEIFGKLMGRLAGEYRKMKTGEMKVSLN
jgi:hypothetical protein